MISIHREEMSRSEVFARLYLAVDGDPEEVDALWRALRFVPGWDVLISTTGRVVLRPHGCGRHDGVPVRVVCRGCNETEKDEGADVDRRGRDDSPCGASDRRPPHGSHPSVGSVHPVDRRRHPCRPPRACHAVIGVGGQGRGVIVVRYRTDTRSDCRGADELRWTNSSCTHKPRSSVR